MYHWGCGHLFCSKEKWMLKKVKHWCFLIMVIEKTLSSTLGSMEIKPVNPKGNQPWIFIGRTDAEAPIIWSPNMKSWSTGKDPDAGKDRGQEEKGATEDEMVRWHHGHEFEQTPGIVKDRTWHAAVHELTKSQTWLSDWTATKEGN